MKVKLLLLTGFICCILKGCIEKSIPNCDLSRAYILKDSASVIPVRKLGNMMIEYRDKGTDSIKGGYYVFDELNHLREYFFSPRKKYILIMKYSIAIL